MLSRLQSTEHTAVAQSLTPPGSALPSSLVPRWVLWAHLIFPTLGLTAFIPWPYPLDWDPLLAGSLLGFIRRQEGTDTSLVLLCVALEASADPTSSICVSAWLLFYPKYGMETWGHLAHSRNGFLKNFAGHTLTLVTL